MFGAVKKFINRDSKKDSLIMSNLRGFFNLTSVNATETYGKTSAFAIIMYKTNRKSLLQLCFERNETVSQERLCF